MTDSLPETAEEAFGGAVHSRSEAAFVRAIRRHVFFEGGAWFVLTAAAPVYFRVWSVLLLMLPGMGYFLLKLAFLRRRVRPRVRGHATYLTIAGDDEEERIDYALISRAAYTVAEDMPCLHVHVRGDEPCDFYVPIHPDARARVAEVLAAGGGPALGEERSLLLWLRGWT